MRMDEKLVSYGFYCAVYPLEAFLVVFLFYRGQWRRLTAVSAYLCTLLAVDGVGRSYFLYQYGRASLEYAYFYWLTDVVLALGAFVLVCAFFWRACLGEEKLWRFVRLLLVFVFFLVAGISAITLSRNLSHIFTRFIIEFQQNLYFTCLVLNTLLYLLMQQLESVDDELGLLVCGMGIQLAGPAATLALVHLTPGQSSAEWLLRFISPLATMGMLATWFYAVARMPQPTAAPAGNGDFSDAKETAPIGA